MFEVLPFANIRFGYLQKVHNHFESQVRLGLVWAISVL